MDLRNYKLKLKTKRHIPADIIEKIKLDFKTKKLQNNVLEKLIALTSDLELGFDRIPRCILYISNGSYKIFEQQVSLARKDWRDVIVQAEYDTELIRKFDFNKTFDKNSAQ